jgi:hypothetical protein
MKTNSRSNLISKNATSDTVNAPVGKQYFSPAFKKNIEKAITCYAAAKSIFKYSQNVFFSARYSFSAN